MKQTLRTVLLVGTGMIAGLLIAGGWRASGMAAQSTAAPSSQPGCQTFPETGYTVCGKFLAYWQQHGGLAQQGFPISQQFTETSALNGKPYTVQYFERAVFELHPENQPPFDVLLSQLGTFLGQANYGKGFPKVERQPPFYDNNATGVQVLKSFYNAINRKEYERAYSYFQGAPTPDPAVAPPYAQFVAGYADTTSVQLAVGQETVGAAAGNLYADVPTVLFASHKDGNTVRFAGCYFLHRTNPGVDPNPVNSEWHIISATLTPAPAGATLDTLLAQTCVR
ncbi:MAG TPA: hypothetical protein VM536_22425 [Chloroflexia bacterium]|nr:hypothetical protein [Chloroflexia bacterium]